MSEDIVPWDIDEATYIGSEDDGCYYLTGQGPDGKWYVTVCADSETNHSCYNLLTDDGPYESDEAARNAARDVIYEWCCNNNVDTGDHGDYPD